MNKVASGIDDRVRKVVACQILGTLIAAAFFFVMGKGGGTTQAALGGGLIGIATTLLLSRSVKRAGAATGDQQAGLRILYLGAAQRFFFVLAAFILGLAVLKLQPLALFVGFALAQAGYLINARAMTRND